MHWAIDIGSDAIVGVLLRYGADPNLQRSSDGWTPLHFAAFFNKPACLKTVLSGSKACRLEIRDMYGMTALDYARERNNHACVALLEQYAADPTTFGSAVPAVCGGAAPAMSDTPLIKAVKAKNQAEVEKILAVSTADLDKGSLFVSRVLQTHYV